MDPIKYLPHSPGVYVMRDNRKKIIYIGKAKDLKKRVSSYFQKNDLPSKSIALISVVRQIDYIPTDSERESLLLEQKLIRDFQPFYNTVWKDDKSYPYLKLTMGEDFPRLILTRQKKNDGSCYFGPYPNITLIKRLLRTLWKRRIFPLRPCNFPFQEKDILKEGGLQFTQPSLYRKVQSCIYLHTKECTAPCVGQISKKYYRKIACKAELFFRGKNRLLQTELEKEMKDASKNLNYEKAAQFRDQLFAHRYLSEKIQLKKTDEESITKQMQRGQALKELQEKLRLPVPPIWMEAFDISNIQGTEAVGSLVVFKNGTPSKSEYRKFKVKTVQGSNDCAMIAEVVKRHVARLTQGEKKFPDLILLDGGKGQLFTTLKSLNTFKLPRNLSFVALAKQKEELFLSHCDKPICLPKDSPALHLVRYIRDEAHRFAITFHRQRRKKAMFH